MWAIWREWIAQFWPIWVVTTLASAIFAAWALEQAATPTVQNARQPSVFPNNTRDVPWGAVTAVSLLALLLACYIGLTLAWEDFAHYDDSYFTLFSLKGLNYPAPIWPVSGRFFPLAHQEFNLIGHLTHTVVGYHVMPDLELLILCCVLLILDRDLSVKARAGIVAVLLVAPGTVISFGGLVYPERNAVFCLVCLLLCVKRFEETQFIRWAVAAVILAQIMVYEKETSFLLLLGFGVGRLLLNGWNRHQQSRNRSWISGKADRLDLCLISVAIIYLIFYVAVVHHRPPSPYGERLRLSLWETSLSYMKLDLLVWLFTAFAISRAYFIARRMVLLEPFWDGWALGALTCFAGYLCLGLASPYYLAPVDLIAVLYVGRFVFLAFDQQCTRKKLVIRLMLAAVLLQSVSISAFGLFGQKNLILAKAEIARVIEARYHNGQARRLFFPFASPYVVSEFAAYLNYRGIPVEGTADQNAGLSRVIMVARTVRQDGPCVTFSSPTCRAGTTPDPGDLVIVLPDDDASLAEVSPYRNIAELQFAYQPYPGIPHWLRPLVEHLELTSPLFNPWGRAVQAASPHLRLPDRWLDASVSMWE